MTGQRDYEIFEAGDVTLQSGAVFPAMKLAYKTYGTLSAAKDNVILYPTSFSAQHFDTERLIGPDGVLDPTRYFIVIPNLFGNGLSSSPSNSGDGPFPLVSYHDAIAVQHRLLTERFGIEKLALVYGWSMGGMQTYHWAALSGDAAFRDGRFVEKPTAGYRAMGRVYAGWAMSHGFYRDELWREAGFTSLEDYLVRNWDTTFARRDANDLLAQAGIWQRGNISACAAFGGDLDRALAAITAHMLLMPGATDRYFDVRDNEDELPKLVNARSAVLHPIPSQHGHRAGNPVNNPRDQAFLKAEVAALLSK